MLSALFIINKTQPSGQNRQKKQSEGVFVNSALKLQCHVVKNNTPTDCFSAIFPTESWHWLLK